MAAVHLASTTAAPVRAKEPSAAAIPGGSSTGGNELTLPELHRSILRLANIHEICYYAMGCLCF